MISLHDPRYPALRVAVCLKPAESCSFRYLTMCPLQPITEADALSRQIDTMLQTPEAFGNHFPYIAQMWKHTLERHAGSGPRVDWFGNNKVFPYVPIHPEDYGVPLTGDSTLLDIGTLEGYGLFDFYCERKAANLPAPRMIGLDIDHASTRVGAILSQVWCPNPAIRFIAARAEAIPLANNSIDLLIARLVLPYTRLRPTLSEFARLLKPNGLIVFQIHTPGYYWDRLRHASRKVHYYLRPILSGALHRLAKHQPAHPAWSEVALGDRELVSLCRSYDLVPMWRAPATLMPILLFRHQGFQAPTTKRLPRPPDATRNT